MTNRSRDVEHARILADVLLSMTDEEAARLIPPRPPRPASQHDTYLDRSYRSERSLRHLLIAMLRQRDGNGCYLCNETLDADSTCIEHIIPLCYGGENEPWNVALACSRCNTKKGNHYVSQYVSSGRPCYHLHRVT